MTLNESQKGECRDGHLWQAVMSGEIKKAVCTREGCNAEFTI